MAIAVASVSTTAISTVASGTISFTKPTGLAVGDLLLAIIQHEGGTVSTLSGWTALTSANITRSSIQWTTVQYKVATSGDVAASTFAFSGTGVDNGGGTLYRITGAGAGSIAGASGQGTGDQNTVSVTVSVTPVAPVSLVIVSGFAFDATASAGLTNFYLTGGTSPTFTPREVYEDIADNYSLGCADAIYSSSAAITAIGFNNGVGQLISDQFASIVIIPEVTDGLGTNALLDVSPTHFNQAGVAGTAGTSALLEVSPTQFDQSGRATAPTQWTSATKTTTTWTNTNKS